MSFETNPLPIPSWMIIDAVRYAIGSRSSQVSTTVEWLLTNWEHLPAHTRTIIRQDLEGEFSEDDRARAEGAQLRRLGDDPDRRYWEQVRALWRNGFDEQ